MKFLSSFIEWSFYMSSLLHTNFDCYNAGLFGQLVTQVL